MTARWMPWVVALSILIFFWIEATHPEPGPYIPPSAPVTLCQGMTSDQCDAFIDRQRP